MSFNLNTKQLEYWLRKKEFRVPELRMTGAEIKEKEYILMERNNRILGRSFHHTFEKWFKKWGRIPTPQEFVAMQMQDIRKNYSNEGWKRKYNVQFKWTATVEKGIKQRLLRSYKSFINELHTELIIKEMFPHVKIVRNDELDYSGIDLLVVDKKNQVEHKIHITKASEYAIDFLFKKEGKEIEFRGYTNKLWAVPRWKKLNHAIYKERCFAGHTFFLYGTGSCWYTRMVNGYPLFTRAYVQNKLEANIMLKKGA